MDIYFLPMQEYLSRRPRKIFDAVEVDKNILLHHIQDIICQVEVIITLKRRQEY